MLLFSSRICQNQLGNIILKLMKNQGNILTIEVRISLIPWNCCCVVDFHFNLVCTVLYIYPLVWWSTLSLPWWNWQIFEKQVYLNQKWNIVNASSSVSLIMLLPILYFRWTLFWWKEERSHKRPKTWNED